MCNKMRGWASLAGQEYACMSSSSQKEACIQHTGELAAAVLVATGTHMDLTGVTACWPVLRLLVVGTLKRYSKALEYEYRVKTVALVL
jgi:hypothetical protein